MFNTHMPFINENSAQIDMILCRREGEFNWKIHVKRGETYIRLDTGVDPGCVECTPCFSERDGIITVSFIAGGSINDREWRQYCLYKREYDLDLTPISPAVKVGSTPAGFISDWGGGRLSYESLQEARIEIFPKRGNKVSLFADSAKIYRLSYVPDDEGVILISGSNLRGEFSIRFDLKTGKQEEIFDGGIPAYKLAEFDGSFWYARRSGPGFEDREIVKAENIQRYSSEIFLVG